MTLLSTRTMAEEGAKHKHNTNEVSKHKNNATEAAKKENESK